VQRRAIFLLACLIVAHAGNAQNSSSSSAAAPPAEQAAAQASPDSDSEQLTAAETALANSDFKAAEAKLDPWLAAHPNDARALFDAGYIADSQSRLDDAASLYRRAVDADPDSFKATLSYGLLLARQGKFADAHPLLVRATQLDPGDAGPEIKARAWRALARIDRDTDTTQASNDLLEALKLSPETPDDTLLAAYLADKAGQTDAAEAAYRRVLGKDPKSEAANGGLAHVLIEQKKYPEAETLLRAALDQHPDEPVLTAQLAEVLVAQDKAEALPLLQKLHDAHPDDAGVTRMLAGVLSDAGDYAGSDELYVKLLAAAPQDPGLLLGHAEDLVRQVQFEAAYAVFDKDTQLDPGSAEGWGGLAFTASRTGRPTVTLHALAMRAKIAPDNASTLFLWATAYDSLHQKANAAAYYHHFLDASAGKFANEEWQARQRLQILERK
jgi:predicted Zn-dependent protease